MGNSVTVALLVWLCVAGGLVALETWVGNLYLLMLALASGLLAVLVWLGIVPAHDVFTQLAWFSGFSIISLAVVRPLCMRWFLKATPIQPSNTDALFGQKVEVLEIVSITQVGRVRLLRTGETWTALLHDTLPAKTVLQPQAIATIHALEGARLIIMPLETSQEV
jgi:membrane protein implicated in regulation of membrane protease activity